MQKQNSGAHGTECQQDETKFRGESGKSVMQSSCSRREFLIRSTATVGAMGAGSVLAKTGSESDVPGFPRGKAESCIFIWLPGGACQVDTWDQKRKGDGDKQPGSYYDPISTAIPGVRICEHLSQTAPLLDRAVLMRTVHHELDEHGAATNRLHTGRPTSGTTIYPSIGSVVCHQRGPLNEALPAYMVMGYPNATRNPGFLGPRYGYVYLTETRVGPRGLRRPPGGWGDPPETA